MKKFVLEPLVGVGIINLGDTKAKVYEQLGNSGTPDSETDYYCNNALQIHYKNDKVDFIEFCNDEVLEVEIYGINPFKTLADDLLALLKEKNGPVFNKREAPFSYAFKSISVGIFRESSESEVLESIDECKKDGTYEENKDWLEEDLEKFKYFQTIGIGVKGYYRKD
jgi:hypothetical protein